MIENKVMRWTIKITSMFAGILILLIVATTATDPYELATLQDIRAFRAAGMLGFMGWVFAFVSTIKPPKEN